MHGVRSSEVATGADPGSGERELQALGFLADSVESFPSSPTDGSGTELPSLIFHLQALRGLPSTCWGSKGRCVQGSSSCLTPRWGN